MSDEDLATINGQLIGGVELAKLIAHANQVVTIWSAPPKKEGTPVSVTPSKKN